MYFYTKKKRDMCPKDYPFWHKSSILNKKYGICVQKDDLLDTNPFRSYLPFPRDIHSFSVFSSGKSCLALKSQNRTKVGGVFENICGAGVAVMRF